MHYKYPRTYHHPKSLCITSDDKKLSDMNHFENKIVVISKKMDGENSTLYNDHYHARSLDSKDHSSRHWLKAFHASIKYLIPDGFRICGENMFQKHSIHYTDLESYFYGFSVWDNDTCLSYTDTLSFCEPLNILHVPVLYVGKYYEGIMEEYYDKLDTTIDEGLVMRNADSFSYSDFKNNVVKFVRPNHVTTDSHWMHQTPVKNLLK